MSHEISSFYPLNTTRIFTLQHGSSVYSKSGYVLHRTSVVHSVWIYRRARAVRADRLGQYIMRRVSRAFTHKKIYTRTSRKDDKPLVIRRSGSRNKITRVKNVQKKYLTRCGVDVDEKIINKEKKFVDPQTLWNNCARL